MDKNDAFLFDVIVLHPIDTLPTFTIRGKISGQKEICIGKKIKDKISFWETTFGGGFFVNVVRIILCFIFGLALIILFSILFDRISLKIKTYKLRNAVQKIVSRHKVSQQVVIDFNLLKKSELREMYQWINTTDEGASNRYEWIQKKLSSKEHTNDVMYREEEKTIKQLKQKGYLTIKDGKIIINKSMQNDFMYVYKRLKKQRILNFDIIFS